MSGLIPFDFDGKKVSVITEDDGSLWFIASEVASILSYSDSYEMTKKLDDDEKANRRIAGLGRRGVTTISEAGLYAAILSSQKAEAKPFKRWVTHEVLPSIRKTGSYQIDEGTRARLRHETVGIHKAMNGVLVARREKDGKGCAAHHFMNEAKLINHVLLGKFKGVDRDALSLEQLGLLAKLEMHNTILIAEGTPYASRKVNLEQLAKSLLENAPQLT